MSLPTRRLIIIYGPTGVGKSSFALALASKLDSEIINADMAQLYKPLSIGTAKPDWLKSSIKHHLFDVIDEPIDCTAMIYRQMVEKMVQEVWSRHKTPIIVGGSGFYIHSLFFVPSGGTASVVPENREEISWDLLNQIDPLRAHAIHPHDKYRIARAHAIWRQTGKLPSQMVQTYSPLASSFTILHLTRDRGQLELINNSRTLEMIEKGWLDECKELIERGWEPFVRRKKFIGYSTLFDCIHKKLSREQALPLIQQRTRQYAKRQETFWRVFPRSFNNVGPEGHGILKSIVELNLTLGQEALYINQLLEKMKNLENKGDVSL